MYMIAVEGIEASGKTTFAKALIASLDSDGYKTLYTADPGYESISGVIRDQICKHKYRNLTTLMLISAARSNNYHEVVLPAMKDGAIVITDRYVLTSYVYHVPKCGYDTVQRLHNIGTDSSVPQQTFIIDVPVEISRERIAKRNESYDVFDNAGFDTMSQWRSGFLASHKKYKLKDENEYVIINGMNDVNDMVQEARKSMPWCKSYRSKKE